MHDAKLEEDTGPDARVRGAIWLVGMMGVGKSTIAPLLARALGRSFVDTDREVERAAGCSVAEIFASQGEPAFRELEARAIEAAATSGAVVALGGGAIAQPGAATRLRETGTVVYLKATPEQLLRRIGDPESRPLLQGLDEDQRLERLTQLLEQREVSYCSADVTVDAGSNSFENVAELLAARLAATNGRSQP